MPGTDVVFLAVGTPSRRGDGHAGLSFATEADMRLLQALIGSVPETPLEVGLGQFAAWYGNYRLNGMER